MYSDCKTEGQDIVNHGWASKWQCRDGGLFSYYKLWVYETS
ncbi:hypothetical protein ACWC2M_22815 [Streptomyces sp. NPDC001761]